MLEFDPEDEDAAAVRCFCGDAGAETRRWRVGGSGVVGRSEGPGRSSRSVSEPDWWSCVRARRMEGRTLPVLECEEEEWDEAELELELEPEPEDEVRIEGAGGCGERVVLAGRVLGDGELRREKEESLSSAWG